MEDFKHVADARLRGILMNASPSDDEIRHALDTTREAVEADAGNPDVPYQTLNAREGALEEAEGHWDSGRNGERAITALRTCWSV